MGNSESQENDGYSAAPAEESSSMWGGKTKTSQPGTGPMKGLREGLTKAGQTIGVVEKPRTVEDDVCEMCPSLTMKQRVAGFCAMCGLGYLLSIMGTLILVGGYTDKNVRTFAELYIIGNFIAISATAFFVGCRKLYHRMIAKTRRVGTAVWFSLMIAIFVCAILHVPIIIILVLLVLETMAGIWYAASYIPYGRRMIVTCCKASLFSPCPDVCNPLAAQV